MTPEEADAKQEWKGMDGSEAFEIIAEAAYEHDSSAGESYDNAVREMMHAWIRANQGGSDGICPLTPSQTVL